MRIAMMGSGGIGGYIGARLAQAGEDITFIAGALIWKQCNGTVYCWRARSAISA